MNFIDPTSDPWVAAGEDPSPAPADALLLTPTQWLAVAPHWPDGLRAGLRLPNDADLDRGLPQLHRLALMVLDFPSWTDGRAYSQARLLRTRLRFAGEIRAAGEVLVDMLPLLQRTGFDAVQLRPDQRVDSARRALAFFDGHYQGDAAEPRPRFRRDPSTAAVSTAA